MHTPRLILDSKQLLSKINEYSNHGEIYYPIKANANSDLIRFLEPLNINFNVNSLLYLNKLVKHNINPKRILWDNCLTTNEEYKYIIKNNINRFTVDSQDDYEYISKMNLDAKYFIKISIDDVNNNRFHKFGIQNAYDLIKRITKEDKLEGLSFYLDNESFNFENFAYMVEKALSFTDVNYINIGGCLLNFLTDKRFSALLKNYQKKDKFKKLIIEPGRTLLNPATIMRTSVIKIRELNNKKWIKVDASIYSGLIDIYIEKKKIKFKNYSGELENYLVSGYTSDSEDFFGEFSLPKGLQNNDLLDIINCGAYIVDMNVKYSGAKKISMEII
jgi:diaminopimelate decarboxylase